MQRPLLTLAAAVECLTGVALVTLPGLTISLLLGIQPGEDGSMIGRIAGVALFALGVACWSARAHAPTTAANGTLDAMTLYNTGAGALLVAYFVAGKLGGRLGLLVGVLHLVLGAAFAIARWRAPVSATAR
jgi:hypothetical protein